MRALWIAQLYIWGVLFYGSCCSYYEQHEPGTVGENETLSKVYCMKVHITNKFADKPCNDAKQDGTEFTFNVEWKHCHTIQCCVPPMSSEQGLVKDS